MSTSQWIVVRRQRCDIVGEEVECVEKRLYPDDRLPDTLGYHVIARSCSHALTCNLAGCQCRWSLSPTSVDRLN